MKKHNIRYEKPAYLSNLQTIPSVATTRNVPVYNWSFRKVSVSKTWKQTLVLSFKYVLPLIMNPVPLGEVQQLVLVSSFPRCMEPWNWHGLRLIGATFGFNSLFASGTAISSNKLFGNIGNTNYSLDLLKLLVFTKSRFTWHPLYCKACYGPWNIF